VRIGPGDCGNPKQLAFDGGEDPAAFALRLGILRSGEFIEAVGDSEAAVGKIAAF
jgi:hypothetical protein